MKAGLENVKYRIKLVQLAGAGGMGGKGTGGGKGNGKGGNRKE